MGFGLNRTMSFQLVTPSSGARGFQLGSMIMAMLLGTPGVMAQPPRESSRATGRVGEILRFEAAAEGSPPFKYQWRKDGGVLPGETGAVLILPLYQESDAGAYDVVVSNDLGSATCEAVALIVSGMNPIPANPSATLGGSASFALDFNPALEKPATYQWRRDGVNLTGATNATLAIAGLTEGDFGAYSALVTTGSVQFVSGSAPLDWSGASAEAPTITMQPLDATLRSGTDPAFSIIPLALSVAATGTPAPTFQWRRDGVDLPGATGATLLLENARRGAYTVAVSNPGGTVMSRTAAIELNTGSSRLRNLGWQVQIGTQSSAQTFGFYILGPAPKRLLVRAVGPTLGVFGVPNILADPALELFSATNQLIGSSDNWGSLVSEAALVRTEGAAAGAFALVEGSADAATVASVSPGAHTIKTFGVDGTAGVVLVELYDLDEAATAKSRLVNLSRRDIIARPGDLLVSGFVVDGTAAKTFLIRAIGPTLRVLGVENAVARPKLRLLDGGNRVVAANVAWESAGVSQKVISLSARAGAFPLPRGIADSCVLASLPPGNYTAEVSAIGSDTGEVIFEIYEVQ
jgi:hypothetical protein